MVNTIQGYSMLQINTKISSFRSTAFQPGSDDFITVDSEDLKGKWNVFFFYPADFTYVCPTELEDLADNYNDFQKMGVDIYESLPTVIFVIKLCMIPPRP